MAQAFNPNPLSVNGMGVPVAERPVPTEEQALEDTITFLRNSIYFFGDDPDAADAVQHCRERIAEVERELSMSREAERIIPASRCPICGLDLTEHPHSEAQCAEWFAEDYRDADETRADLWQF